MSVHQPKRSPLLRLLFSAVGSLLLSMFLFGCDSGQAGNTESSGSVIAPPPTASGASASPATSVEISAVSPAATREGAQYVLRLPRETSLPPAWAMDRAPDYEARNPQAGDTYRFACRDMPARSVGLASVGYRSLEGLPSVVIEYVIYGSPEEAASALSDMRAAVDDCPEFVIGSGSAATSAGLMILDYPEFGEASFAAVLDSSSPTTGDLVTHLLKVRHANVIIGIHQTVAAADAPPDESLTAQFAETALDNLSE